MAAWPLATRSSFGRLTLAVTWLTLAPDLRCLAQEQQPSVQPECFSTSSLVGAVLGTFFSTIVAVAAAFLFWWICFRRRFNQDECEQPKKRPPGSSVEAGVGFDNPCFEEHPSTDVADGTKSTDDGRKEAKSSSWTPLRFFGPSRSQKKRSMDDSFITEPERVSVQLRGHDFTGLGFNVTGNMRDGIYIKDILNRGPAFESGKIAQGDKILSLNISFRHVVYEDALTILSYASPYDVTLELEKNNGTATSTLKQRKATSATSLAGSGSSIVAVSNLAMPDVPYNDRLVHPLYRSQSIDDLSKVGRADAALRADVKIPSLSAQLAGGALIKSKMQTKANLEVELPHGPDAKMKSAAKDVTVDVGDISVAPPDVSLTVDKPSKFAKFGIKVLPDFKFRRGSNGSSNSGGKPDTSVQVNLGKLPSGLEASAEVPDLPKVEIHMPKASDVAIDVDIPDGPNIGVPSVSVQLPSMPDVSVSAPGVQLSADVPDLAPAVDVAIDMDEAKLPKVDVDVAGVSLDVKGPAVEFSAPEISVGAPKIDVDLPDVGVAGIEGQVDLPDVSVEPKLPTLDAAQVTVVAPEFGLKEAKSGFHIKFPKFGGGGGAAKTKADVGDVSLGVAVPEVEVSLPEVDVETETKTKKETPGAKSGFEFKMPKWDMKKKAGAPDVKIDLPEAEIQPATAAGEISVEVKAPEASIEVPAVSVEAAGAKKSKIGMGFSMPKFHMGKGHAEAKDAAAVDVELAAPKIELAAPQLSVQVAQSAGAEVVLSDEEGEASGAKKKSKFSLKMPKMPKGKVQADVEVGAVSLPKATVELKEDEAEAVDDKDEAGGRSKKSKFGLKMPKWNVNKPQVELEVQGAEGKVELPKIDVAAVDTTLEASTSADINVPAMPSVDVELKSSGKDVTSDDEEEGAKKKAKFSLTMPKFGIGKPHVDLPEVSASADVNVELPKVEIEASKTNEGEEKASEKKKGFGFGFKMPKMGASGAADVEADLQVNAPKIDVKVEGAAAEENDHDHPVGEKKKSKFSLKMPKFGMSKPHVDSEALIVELPSVEVSAEAPEANIEVDVPKVALPEPQVSVAVAGAEVEHDSDDEKDDVKSDKKKMKFGLKMPKFGINKPQAEVEVDVNAPALTAAAPQVEIEAKAGDEHPEKKKSHGFGISMPKFFGGGAKAEVDVDVPDLSKQVAVEASVDVAALEEAGDDGDHGNKKKMGLKLPKFGSLGLGKPQADVQVEIDPSLDIDLPSASLGVSHDEGDESKDADHNKGKSKFSIKMPKFHGSAAVPSAEVAGDMAVGAEIELPQVDVQLKRHEENDSDDEAKKTKKGAKFGIKLPGLHFDQSHDDDSAESSGDEDEAKSKKTKVGIKLPKIGFSKPQIDADVDVRAPSVTVEGDIQAPQFGIEAQLSDDETDDEKITKFGIKLPTFGLKKPSVDVDVPSVDAEVNVPNLAVQVDVEMPKVDLEVDAPKMELEVPAVSVDLDAGEDETGAKKKAAIGFKLPKFSKKSADLDIAVEGDVAAREVDEDSDDDSDKKKMKFGIKMPKFGIKKPNVDVDVDLSSTKDIVVEADVEAPKIDLNDAAITAGIDVPQMEVEVPAVPAVQLDIEAPSVDITVPEISVDVPDLSVDAAKKKGKFSIDMPKINFSKPSFDIKLGGSKDVSVDVPELAATGVSVEAPDVEVSAPEIEVAASVEVPKVDVDVEADVDVDVEKKKGKGFTFKMPKIHLGKQHAEVKVDAPKDVEAEMSVDVPKVSAEVDKIEIDLPKVGLDAGVSASKDDADSDDEKKESGKKKSHRFAIKMPKFHMNKAQVAEVELPPKEVSVEGKASLPKVEVEAEEEHEGEGGEKRHAVKAKFGIKMPKFHLNKATDVELAKEESKNQGAKDADSDDESADKKSSATIEVAVPKIGLEAPSLELDTGLSAELAEGKINLPKSEVDLKLKEELEKEAGKKKGKFSFKMPKFHGHVGTKSHGGAEVEIASPSASLDPTINVNLPKVEVEAQAKAAESDDEAEGAEKKKSKFAIRMPKLRKPHADVDVDVSKAVSVDVAVPKVDLPSVTAAVPKVELEAAIKEDDESDDESDKKRTKFAFKRPKMYVKPELEMAVPELNIGAANLEVELPDVDINAAAAEVIKPVEIDLPDLEAKMDIGFETESDEDKNKGGIALDLTAPAMALESKIADLGLLAAAADVELPSVDVAVQPVDVEFSPDLGSLDTAVDVKIKKPKFGFKLPSLHPSKVQVEVPAPEIEANVEVPSVSVEVKHEDSDSEDDKKPTKFGIKMPKFHLGKKEAALPSATVQVPKVELAAEAEDAVTDPKVKTMKFDIDLPELKMIDPTLDVDQANLPAAEVAVPAQLEVEVKKPKFGIKLPVIEFGKPKVTTSVDVQVSKDVAEAEISLPQVQDIEISQPELEALLPSAEFTDLNVPDIHLATESINECVNFDVNLPDVQLESPELAIGGDVDVTIDAPAVDIEVPQIEAALFGKKEDDISDDERGSKSSGFSFGLKMPKFSLGTKEKSETAEPKVEIEAEAPKVEDALKAAVSVDLEAPKLNVEVSAHPPQVVGEKEKKKFNLGLKMPKLNLSKGHAEGEAKEGEAESKSVKINVKPPKPEKKKKQKANEEESDREHSDDESKDKEKEAASLPSISSVDIKLPRVQVYKSIEHPEGVRDHEGRSSDEEDDVKDIKKNIGARFGVKLKKPKMFSSSKAEITKGDTSSALQPEWRLPRVDLRRTKADQELTVDIDSTADAKLEQLSPSERAEAIRRDAKMSAGIRVHSPGLVLASPRSKKEKSSLQLDVESQSSPRLLSVTRLDPTPPAEQPASQPLYIAAEVSGQVPASEVPSSVLMASEAVKLKRGPVTPAKRTTILDTSSPTGFSAAIPVTSFESKDVTPASVISGQVSVISDVDANQNDNGNLVYTANVSIPNRAQVSDTDISITTSTGSDTLVISTVSSTDTPTSRKAASLGDLTRITHASSNNDDGTLERTVSLDFKPVAPLASSSSTTSRAIHNLAVQDLSRVGEDSDEDYSLNRKRPATSTFDSNLNVEVTGNAGESEAPHSPSKRHNRTLLAVDTDGSDVSIRPLDSDSAEALWFNRNIQIPDHTSTTHISYTHMESLSADVTLTTSLGTSPSDTSTSSSDGSPISPASPEPSEGSLPLMQPAVQVENGSNQQYHTEVIEINQDELDLTYTTGISTRGVSVEVTSAEDESQPQPLTDLNPSAGNFAAVRNRFEQLSNRGDTNGSEVTVTRTPRLSQGGLVKRLSGTFEDVSGSVNLVQKSVMHIAPELSEGALSRTVIISSLQLDRSTENPSSVGTGVGPESPVPQLEPPC